MAIRLRTVNGLRVALCAAETDEMPDDVYLDDGEHYALTAKFALDRHGETITTTYHEEWGAMATQKLRDAKETLLEWRAAELKNRPHAAPAAPDEAPTPSAGGECYNCGFRYFAYAGHIIPCPRCALTAALSRELELKQELENVPLEPLRSRVASLSKKLADAIDRERLANDARDAFAEDCRQRDERIARLVSAAQSASGAHELLKRFRQWDQFEPLMATCADGPYWKREIDAALNNATNAAQSAMAPLDELDRRLSEMANKYMGTVEDYYLHGLWRAREEIKAMRRVASGSVGEEQ